MSKELPYFRFYCQEWQNDNIGFKSYDVQGLFISICSTYWIRDCRMTLAMLKQRYGYAKELLDELLEANIIKVRDDEEKTIDIKFLNEQFDLLSEKRNKKVEAGRLGGLKRSSNARSTAKSKKSSTATSYKDKDKNKDKDKLYIPPDLSSQKGFETEWMEFLKHRKNKRAKPTIHAQQLIINSLAQRPDQAVEALQEAIQRNWTGFKWEWFDNGRNRNRPHNHYTAGNENSDCVRKF